MATPIIAVISDVFSSQIAATKLCPAEEVAAIAAEPFCSPGSVQHAWEHHQQDALIGDATNDFDRWESILTDAGERAPTEELASRAVALEWQTLYNCCPPLPGMHMALEAISHRCKLSFWTNVSPMQLAYIASLGIPNYANVPLIASCEIRRLKSSREVLRGLAIQMDCDPSECLLYDDSLENLALGKSLGMITVLAYRGEVLDRFPESATRSDHVDHVAHRPGDLIAVLDKYKD